MNGFVQTQQLLASERPLDSNSAGLSRRAGHPAPPHSLSPVPTEGYF